MPNISSRPWHRHASLRVCTISPLRRRLSWKTLSEGVLLSCVFIRYHNPRIPPRMALVGFNIHPTTRLLSPSARIDHPPSRSYHTPPGWLSHPPRVAITLPRVTITSPPRSFSIPIITIRWFRPPCSLRKRGNQAPHPHLETGATRMHPARQRTVR